MNEVIARECEKSPEEYVKEVKFAIEQFCADFPPVEYEERPVCIPGIGDVFLRRVERLGYKGAFPRPYDWENLLPQLQSDEELLWIIRKRGSEDEQEHEKSTGLLGNYSFDVYLGLKYTGDAPLSPQDWKNRGKRFAAFTRHFARAAFPESLLKKDQDEGAVASILADIASMKEARIVVGMPSVKDAELKDVAARRDERIRPYAGLNDIVEMFGAPEDNFALVFAVSKAQEDSIRKNFEALFRLQNEIKPKIETAIQNNAGGSITFSENETHTTSESSTNETKGGVAIVRNRSWIGKRFAKGLGRGFRNFLGYFAGQDTNDENLNTVTKIGVQTSHSESDAKGTGVAATGNWSKTTTIKEVNSMLEFASEHIKESLGQLRQVLGTGGYHCAAVAYSNDQFLAQSVAESARAVMSGGQSALLPMRTTSFVYPYDKDWLIRKKTLARVLAEEDIQCGILNCEKACLYLPVPTTHLIGLPIKKNVFYGKDSCDGQSEDASVKLGRMSFAELCIEGESVKTIANDRNRLELSMKEKDFYSHFFVVGTTGSGKTKRSAHILHCAKGFRRIILETAKKTYWNELGLKPDELIVYTLGDSTHNPLRFNPFFFEQETNLKQHIAVLADAMTDLLPTSALIGPKLREAAERCYVACGWNIETSKRDDSECELEYPNVAMFKLMVKDVVNEMKDYGNETRGDYTGALLHRASIFMDAVYQDIFAFDGNKTIDELFPPDKAVIIEMEEMPPSEINMPAFIISLLLHRIRAYQSREIKRFTEKEWEKVPGFLIAIEEAHNVLSKSIQQKGDETQSGKGGHLVKQVTRLLAEGRGMHIGMMIIDQSAANVAPSVITNTNTKLVFRQEDGTEIETIGKAIGLKKEEWNDLQLLGQGEFLIRNSRYPHPIKMAPLTKNELDMYKTWKAREEFVEEAKWVPNYQAIEKLLIPYFDVQRIACLKDGCEVSIAAYDDEADSLFKRLCSSGGNVKKDLYKYCIAKALMSLELYGWAAAVLGVNYKEPSTGGECLQ